MGMLQEVQAEISEEDYKRAEYVIEEIQRVLDVCDALEKDDYETVGQKMYETHYGMSKLYEVSCEELDFLNDLAFDCGVTGSRVMGGGFGLRWLYHQPRKRRTVQHLHRKGQGRIQEEIQQKPQNLRCGYQRWCPQTGISRLFDFS